MDLLAARSVEEGVGVAEELGGPSTVMVFADAAGDVGWTRTGSHPKRSGFERAVAVSWTDSATGWNGWLAGAELPSRFEPHDGRVYHANKGPVGLRMFAEVRFHPALFGRAKRIEGLLAGREAFDETTFEGIQRDLSVPVFAEARDIVREVVATDDPDFLLLRVRTHVAEWDGTGAADQTGFRLLDAYFGALQEEMLAPLLAPAREADPDFTFRWWKSWESVRRILEERPPHLRPPPYETWSAFLRSVLRDVAVEMEEDPETPGGDATWEEAVRVRSVHPLGGIPLLGAWLNMDPSPASGSLLTVQVRGPSTGQRLRMVVNPARPERGRFHMPVGQSGHFLSPHYDDFHASWVDKEMRPLIAGPAESSFTLRPKE